MTSFDDYLIDNDINKQNLSLLVKDFKKEVFVPFIGAGCSLPLGSPNWEGLFEKLTKKYNKRINLRKSKDGTLDFPRLFSKLYNKLPPQNNFYKDLFEILEPTITSGTFTHIHLIDAFNSYLTTNYDCPIEKAYLLRKQKELKKYYLFCPIPDTNFNNCIVYLHGHKDINFAVIKENDYQYFYPSISDKLGIPVLEDFLKYILEKKKIIFVGFSFLDRYLIKFLKSFSKNTNKHFLLTDENSDIYKRYMDIAEGYRKEGESMEAQKQESKFYDTFKDDFNILPIVYKANLHIFLESLFKRFSSTDKISIEQKPISGVPVL